MRIRTDIFDRVTTDFKSTHEWLEYDAQRAYFAKLTLNEYSEGRLTYIS